MADKSLHPHSQTTALTPAAGGRRPLRAEKRTPARSPASPPRRLREFQRRPETYMLRPPLLYDPSGALGLIHAIAVPEALFAQAVRSGMVGSFGFRGLGFASGALLVTCLSALLPCCNAMLFLKWKETEREGKRIRRAGDGLREAQARGMGASGGIVLLIQCLGSSYFEV